MKYGNALLFLVLAALVGCAARTRVGIEAARLPLPDWEDAEWMRAKPLPDSDVKPVIFQLLPVVHGPQDGAKEFVRSPFLSLQGEEPERYWLGLTPVADQTGIATAWHELAEVMAQPGTRLVIVLTPAATVAVNDFFSRSGPDSALGIVQDGRMRSLFPAPDGPRNPRAVRMKLGFPLDQEEEDAGTLVTRLLAMRPPADILREQTTARLTEAIAKTDLDQVRDLLRAGAGIEDRDPFGFTPLQRALVLWQHTCLDTRPIAEALLAAGADINPGDDNGRTPLEIALYPTYLPAVRFANCVASQQRLTPDCSFSYGLSPWGSVHVTPPEPELNKALIRWLGTHGADLDVENDWGQTLLYHAVLRGQTERAGLLISLGADINRASRAGSTPLHGALGSGATALAELLIAKGADISALDEYEQSPLHVAAWGWQPRIVKLLLRRGADPNARDKGGATPLHCVVRGDGETDAEKDQRSVIRSLFAAGARADIRDAEGMTPLDILMKQGRSRVEAGRLLREAGGAGKPGVPPAE